MLLLSKKPPRHRSNKSLTQSGRTQETENNTKSKLHKLFIYPRWIRIWSVDSSIHLHRQHLLTGAHWHFFSWYIFKNFSDVASHKETCLGRSFVSSNLFDRKRSSLTCNQNLEVGFHQKYPFLWSLPWQLVFHITFDCFLV